MKTLARALLCGVAIGAMGLSGPAGAQGQSGQSQSQHPGRQTYMLACAQCHGLQGRGDGPLSRVLNSPPSDLTTISKRNDGQFPFYRMFQMVDGRPMVPAHGTREMPAWGAIFAAQAGERFGPFGAETYIRGRLVELVQYLETLQQ